ncbi:translocase of chloroplast 120, chloroplastic [Amaranthus tricolor]|uniref:translocase of chloroplast 120, chloroplastic n=1 Tax=Amaranthus tricolor TaxID=29722 RepID=UPI0025898097|nr:translocase of chloroplast 120, chloroplastic [Amaranthus tricolor]XP_057518008.1 translocase of chloroplast 120, chloroplastic [Amaranthus tricolor]
MDHGVEHNEENTAKVKVVDDGLTESKEVSVDDDGLLETNLKEEAVGVTAHGYNNSQESEEFEEAVELPLDDTNDGSKLDSDVVGVGVGVSASLNGENDADFSAAEGSSRLLDEAEMTDAVEEFSEGRDDNTESKEIREESSMANSHEDSVITVSDDGSMINDFSAEQSQGEGSEVVEIEAVEGDEDAVDKSVVFEASEKSNVGPVDQNDTGASLAEDVKDVITNGDVDHVNETEKDVGDPSDDVHFQTPKAKPDETIFRNLKTDDGDAISSSISEESAGVVSEKVLDKTSTENDDSIKELEAEVLIPEHQDDDLKIEDKSSDTSSSLNVEALTSKPEISTPSVGSSLKEIKNESASSNSGIQNNAVNEMQSSGTVGRDNNPLEVSKNEQEKPNSQAREESTVKPAEKSSAASGKSATPSVRPAQPAGLGRAAPLLEPAARTAHHSRVNGQASQAQINSAEDTTNGEIEEGDEIREKLQMIRVKFLRLAHRLGQTPHNVVVAQVLYRLGLAEQLRARSGGRVGAFSFDRASAMAEQLEAAGQEPLDFSCTIMVLGKTGVGKSATINSIFDEVKFGTDAFQMGTKKVQDVVGTVQGIKVRVIDTPGLLSSCSDQHMNEKLLHSVKRFIKKSPPDIVLYLDRLDMPSRDFGDMPLLRTITEIFGPSIWFNAIVVLTHAASAPPEGPNGTPSTYDMFVTQRSHAVQQVIRQAAGDMRLMNPVSLVENHSACRTNRAGQRVLPNGQVWKPHLLLLSFASKILAEANILLKLQDSPPGKPFTARARAPPLPFLLSSLLQSRPQLKLPNEQFGDEDTLDDDLDVSSESDEESEYDELPPFKPLTKAQLSKLPKTQKKAYYDELEYREKLFMKKQMKDDRRRRRMMKKMADSVKEMPTEYSENVDEESGGAASLPVPMPDLALPASFDSDNPTHRYRYLDSSNQWLVRPVLDNHGWDHDVGYEGINVEHMFVVKDRIPLSFSGQVSKDKKEANLQMEVASSIKHGEGKATTMGFDVQSVGKDMAYTLRSETRFSNYHRNKATAGLSATLMGDALSAGVKLEDKLIINKQLRMVMSGGAMAGRGDIAYGGSLEATFRDKDYPIGRFLSTLGLSIMDWHGELALGCNIQSQIPMGRSTNLVARANLNNRGSGQVSFRLNSSEQLQLALIAFLPLFRKLMGGQRQDHPLEY